MVEYICRKENNKFLIYNRNMEKILCYNSIREIKEIYGKDHIKIIENTPTKNAFTFPFKLFLDISNYCNLNCIHCLSESSPYNRVLLDRFLIDKIIDECCIHGIFQIKVGGGEPLLYPGFWEVIENIRKTAPAIRLSFSTNGTILKEKDILNIKRYNCDISISLDGDSKTHNFIRGSSIFEKVIGSIDMLLEYGIHPTIRYTLMDINLHCIKQIYDFCQDRKLILKVRRYKPTSLKDKVLLTYGSEYYDTVKMLRTLQNCDIEDIMKETRDDKKILYCEHDCGAAFRSVHIDCYGNITPCVFLGEKFFLGNIQNNSIKVLWDTSKILCELREMKENKHCQKCNRRSICHGECLGIRLFYDNNVCGLDKGCLRREN